MPQIATFLPTPSGTPGATVGPASTSAVGVAMPPGPPADDSSATNFLGQLKTALKKITRVAAQPVTAPADADLQGADQAAGAVADTDGSAADAADADKPAASETCLPELLATLGFALVPPAVTPPTAVTPRTSTSAAGAPRTGVAVAAAPTMPLFQTPQAAPAGSATPTLSASAAALAAAQGPSATSASLSGAASSPSAAAAAVLLAAANASSGTALSADELAQLLASAPSAPAGHSASGAPQPTATSTQAQPLAQPVTRTMGVGALPLLVAATTPDIPAPVELANAAGAPPAAAAGGIPTARAASAHASAASSHALSPGSHASEASSLASAAGSPASAASIHASAASSLASAAGSLASAAGSPASAASIPASAASSLASGAGSPAAAASDATSKGPTADGSAPSATGTATSSPPVATADGSSLAGATAEASALSAAGLLPPRGAPGAPQPAAAPSVAGSAVPLIAAQPSPSRTGSDQPDADDRRQRGSTRAAQISQGTTPGQDGPLPDAVLAASALAPAPLNAAVPTPLQAAAVVSQIANQVELYRLPGKGGLRIQLHPDDLGGVEVTVRYSALGAVELHINTENASTRSLVQAGWPVLRDALGAQGISADRLIMNVTTTTAGAGQADLSGGNHNRPDLNVPTFNQNNQNNQGNPSAQMGQGGGQSGQGQAGQHPNARAWIHPLDSNSSAADERQDVAASRIDYRA